MTSFSANFTTKLIPFFKIMLLNSQGIPANGFLSLYELLCTDHFAGCPELLFLETRHRHTMRRMLLNQNGFLAIPPIMRLTSGKWSGSSFIQNEIFSYDSTQEKNHDSYPRCTGSGQVGAHSVIIKFICFLKICLKNSWFLTVSNGPGVSANH